MQLTPSPSKWEKKNQTNKQNKKNTLPEKKNYINLKWFNRGYFYFTSCSFIIKEKIVQF